MKYALLFIVIVGMIGCGPRPAVVPIGKVIHPFVHYPKIVYNSCVDEYAVVVDSVGGIAFFFGKSAPSQSQSNGDWGAITFGGSSGSEMFITTEWRHSGPVRPSLTTISTLHDTLQRTTLGGEFQFKDSSSALASYLRFVKECKDSEDVANIPIRKKIREIDISDSIQRHSDSIAQSKRHIQDSIFACKHTYN